MIEKVYNFSINCDKIVEKVIIDDNLNYIHMVFNKDEGLPEHFTNADVYMSVIRGTLSIILGVQETHDYKAGSLLKIPFQTKMVIKNQSSETLELFVVKAPAPKM